MSTTESNLSFSQFSLRTFLGYSILAALLIATVHLLDADFGMDLWRLGAAWLLVTALCLALYPVDAFLKRQNGFVSLSFCAVFYGALSLGFYLFGEAIERPYKFQDQGYWLVEDFRQNWTSLVWVPSAILVTLLTDWAVQTNRPPDTAYYPRLWAVFADLGRRRTRLVLLVGMAVLLFYWGDTYAAICKAAYIRGVSVWPPKRTYVVCHAIWGMLWLADTLSRPRRGTLTATIGYLMIVFMMLPSGFDGGLRE